MIDNFENWKSKDFWLIFLIFHFFLNQHLAVFFPTIQVAHSLLANCSVKRTVVPFHKKKTKLSNIFHIIIIYIFSSANKNQQILFWHKMHFDVRIKICSISFILILQILLLLFRCMFPNWFFNSFFFFSFVDWFVCFSINIFKYDTN